MLINNSGCLNTQSLVARFVVSGLILFIQPLSTPARAQNASYDVNRPKYKVCTYVANITSGPSLADATSDSTVNQDQIKSEIKTTLNSLGNEIESLIDNSKDINLFQSLLQLYAHNSEAIEKANNNINLEILNKVNDFINRMQLTVGFHARVSYLPVELCDRMSSISMANATAAAAGVANPDSHVGMTTKSYNEGGGIEQGFEQTIHHFEGFSFNVIHEVRESKNKVEAKTAQGIKALLQRKLKSKTLITGGIIVSVPSYFNFPMNIEMDFGDYIPTLKLNDIFFGFDKKNPYKHYIVSNIDYASYTNGKLDFNPRGDKHRPPEINLYFTDEVRYNYNENFLSFSPSMERPLHSLLADIEFKYCQDKNFEFCDKDVRINLSMDQLVLNFKPVVLKFSPEKDPAIFLFPFIKSPTHSSLAENGGIRTALKRWPWDKSSLVLFRSLMTSPLLNNLASQWLPIKSETEPRPEILQFFGYGSGNIYLNGKYSPLATLLQKGLDIVNKSLHKKAISGIATLKYLLNENWDPSTGGLIHSDSHSSKNGTTSNTDAWEEDDWDHPSAYLSGSQNVPAAGAQKQLNRGGFIQLDRTGP